MSVRQSESIAKLAEALRHAQADCDAPSKASKNPHFGSMYANLESVRTAMFTAFNGRGLSLLQMPGYDNGIARLTNRLIHDSGEWIEWDAGAPMAKNDPQSWRGAITYIRRTCAEGVANLAAEDDDGNTASQKPKVIPKPSEGTANTGGPEKRASLTEKNKDKLYAKAGGNASLVHGVVLSVTKKPCTREAWPDLTASEYSDIVDGITAAMQGA